MRKKHELMSLIAAAGLLVASGAAGYAQNSTPEKTPGQQMQDKGSVKGSPGASCYAPGQLMQKKGSVKGTAGASGYAPGRATTGSGNVKGKVKGDVDVKAGRSGAKTDIDADAKVNVR